MFDQTYNILSMTDLDHGAEPLTVNLVDAQMIQHLDATSTEVMKIPVRVSYEIIRLFSEGLYQSPNKAVEELVTNGYDAGATVVAVILPGAVPTTESDSKGYIKTLPTEDDASNSLWVIDNGSGLDTDGFVGLWMVAHSAKATATVTTVAGKLSVSKQTRMPVGQFGIGKLAAYVLAWRLTHISKRNGVYRMASMNFRDLDQKHQFEDTQPLELSLKEISEAEAEQVLTSVARIDPLTWQMLFGASATSSWTAAGMTDFKDLYGKLSTGRLSWVLRTGLPLETDFSIRLNGEALSSSKTDKPTIFEYVIGRMPDSAASSLELDTDSAGLTIPGILGTISGTARIYEKSLTDGKSDQYSRSNGFFVRVRSRIINLEDELFGLEALNHAAWSRFSMEIDADGLRDYLLSSREGVRETDETRALRSYLRQVFNVCRNAYEKWKDKDQPDFDIDRLLGQGSSAFVTEPLIESVRQAVTRNHESFYIANPSLGSDEDREAWLTTFNVSVEASPFTAIEFEKTGPFDRVVRYYPDTRRLIVNMEHPYVEKLLKVGRDKTAASMFASSEVMIDALLQEHGITPSASADLLADRDKVLRLVAGDEPTTAAEVLRMLHSALQHPTALERAVGLAFRILGFEYERRGGSKGETDGVLYARLGQDGSNLADYRIVYDTKSTNKPAVPADKIDPSSLDDFRRTEQAQFGFFAAVAYESQDSETGKVNKKIANAAAQGLRTSLLRVKDIEKIVTLHYQYGVTLVRLRSLFKDAHTVPEVKQWVSDLEIELKTQAPQVPMKLLLSLLEEAKKDDLAPPHVVAVRATSDILQKVRPDKLITSLQALEEIVGTRWMTVGTDGTVRLNHTADQILAIAERNMKDLLGIDALVYPE